MNMTDPRPKPTKGFKTVVRCSVGLGLLVVAGAIVLPNLV